MSTPSPSMDQTHGPAADILAVRIFRDVGPQAWASIDPLRPRLAWTNTVATAADQSTSLADLASMAAQIGPGVDVPARPIRGGLAVSASEERKNIPA